MNAYNCLINIYTLISIYHDKSGIKPKNWIISQLDLKFYWALINEIKTIIWSWAWITTVNKDIDLQLETNQAQTCIGPDKGY